MTKNIGKKCHRKDRLWRSARAALLIGSILLAAGCGREPGRDGGQPTGSEEQNVSGRPEAADPDQSGAVDPDQSEAGAQIQPDAGNPEAESPDPAEGQADPDIRQEDQSGADGTEKPDQPLVLKNLQADGSLFSRTFYQAGDSNTRLYCHVRPGEDGDMFLSPELEVSLTKMEPCFEEIAYDVSLAINGDAQIETAPGQNTYETELSVRSYQQGEEMPEEVCPVVITLPRAEDSVKMISIQPSGSQEALSEEAAKLMGEYYQMTEASDLLERYLGKAEFCAYPTEDLRLMRNTIYAAHGRSFQDQILAGYMERKPWYRERTAPEDFPEEALSKVEKSNIALLKELEQMPSDQRRMIYGFDYSVEDFAFAPYLSLLSVNQETGISADLTRARDCGAYWQAPGSLYLPVTLTREQWLQVRDGEKAEVCVNDLTGEVRILELDDTGNYRLYEKGTAPDTEYPSDIGIAYNYDTGLYEMWEVSDDTIMKPVYEGDLYILKGAVHGAMVSLTTASELQQEITPQMETLSGNRLYHNGRGYFTAIYYLGD